jgi:tetratricopeptide (TPR) repeat protein
VGLTDGHVSLWNVEAIRDRLAEFGSAALNDVGRGSTRAAFPPEPEIDLDRVTRIWSELAALESRAIAAVRAGRWREASSIFARRAEVAGNDHWFLYMAVTAAARGGDRQAFQRLLRELLARSTGVRTLEELEHAVMSTLLLPCSGPDLDTAMRIAVKLCDETPPDHWLISYSEDARALAEYRAGHDAAALEWSAKALSHGRRPSGVGTMAPCIRALAFYRLGRLDEARAELTKAIAMDRNSPSNEWFNVATDHILLAEAMAAILDSDFPANPFAH